MERGDERFEGGIFHDAIPGGRAGAQLSFGADGIVAQTTEDGVYEVPFAGASVELGGASGKMWFCRTPDRTCTVFSEARGFGERLRQAGGPVLAQEMAVITTGAQYKQRRELGVWLAGLAGLGVLGAAFVFGLSAAARLSLGVIPGSVDEKLGDFAVEHMDLSGHPSDDKLLDGAVRQLVERLQAHVQTPFKFRVRVLESSQVNAFALPGGQITVYTGLLREAPTAEQAAGVLAHEISHVTRRHGMQRILQSVGVVGSFQLLFGDLSGVLAVAAELLREGAINGYSREHEHQADMDAVATMLRAQLPADALAAFFDQLAAREHALPNFVQWLGTHPELSSRARDVRAESKRLAGASTPKLEPLALDWSAVRAHAGYHAKEDSAAQP